jgi:PIN domain nuclease of toxin-antitoxin system
LRLLLDTHAVLWWFLDDPSLSTPALQAIQRDDSQVFVSAVSAMEITSKFRVGKLPQAEFFAVRFETMVREYGFEPLSITLAHAALAGSLPFARKDPFDRLLVSQGIIEQMTLVSNERLFDSTGVSRIW